MIQDKPLAAIEWEGPAMALRTLSNGVRLLALPMQHLQSVSVGVFLRVGSRDETPASNSISHVLEHIGAEEVRRVFERMLAHPPAVAITGKGANARAVRQLAAGLAG